MHPADYAKLTAGTDSSHEPRPPITPQLLGLTKAAYSVNETLTLLSIGRTSLYGLVKNGDLTPGKLGKKTLFYSTDIAELLTKLRQPVAAAA